MRGKLASARTATATVVLSTVAMVALALGGTGLARAAAYKWVDDKGVVHYSDHIPAEAVNRGSVKIDPQGRSVQKIDPAPTPDQLREKRVEDEKQRGLQQKQEEQGRRDRALLSSYSSEDEIDLARNRAVFTIDSQLKSAQGYTDELGKRYKDVGKRKLGYGNKPVPPALERELVSLEEEMVRQNALMAQKRQEIASIAGRYELDKQRWRELRTQDFVPTPLPSAEAAKSSAAANARRTTEAAK